MQREREIERGLRTGSTYLSCLQQDFPYPEVVKPAGLSDSFEENIKTTFAAELGLNVEVAVVFPAVNQLNDLAGMAQRLQDGNFL